MNNFKEKKENIRDNEKKFIRQSSGENLYVERVMENENYK